MTPIQPTDETRPGERLTYLLVDGENIDATLGGEILSRRPQPEERPRWNRLLDFTREQWGQPVRGLFFLAANSTLPMPFVQALMAMGYKPVPLSGEPGQKVVDIAIQRTLRELAQRGDDTVLVSHDGDFLDELEAVVAGPGRAALMGFKEFRNGGFAALEEDGLEFFDLEYEVGAFTSSLPRLRVIPIAEFDPVDFL